MKKIIVIAAAIIFLGGLSVLMNSCQTKQSGIRLVAGILDAPLPADAAPQHVQEAYGQALKVHPFEILSDEASSISVCGIGEVDTTSTEGYGIMVTKDATSTTSSAMEGSGVRVEWLYEIRFHDNDSAYVAAVVNPYEVQQALCQRLGYTLDGDSVTLYDGERQLATAVNSLSDMGGFDTEQPLWIGEQLFYDLTGDQVQLQVVPGMKFATSPVLMYDDMPTLSLPVSLSGEGTPAFGEIALLQAAEASDEAEADSYLKAIDHYFVDSVGSHYSKGEFCIPSHTIVAVDEQNAEDIRVWGDFWVFNYNLEGDTLKCVSGGSHPGLAHVQQVDGQFQVTAFDAVEDGSRYLPTAKRIFGERFDESYGACEDYALVLRIIAEGGTVMRFNRFLVETTEDSMSAALAGEISPTWILPAFQSAISVSFFRSRGT